MFQLPALTVPMGSTALQAAAERYGQKLVTRDQAAA